MVFVRRQLVAHRLLQLIALAPGLGQLVHHIHDQMKAIEPVLHPDIERGGDRPLLLIAAPCIWRLVRWYVSR